MLPNKRLDTYNKFLMQIRNLTNLVNPQSVKIDMIDCSTSMMNALDQVYPVVSQKGCLFHLFKHVYKRVQDEVLSQLYMSDEEFRTNIRMISALSFVPIAGTIQAFDTLGNQAGNQEQAVLDYFESNYSPVPNNIPPTLLISQILFADISEIVKTDSFICKTASSIVQRVLISYQF